MRLPLVSSSEDGVWARLATLDAGDQRGTYFRPEIDDEVVVGFLDCDPRFPVVLGQCHSSAKPAPETASDDNNIKGYVSRSKLKLTFDDDKKVVTLETPGGNKLTLDEDAKKVSLADQNGSSITLDDEGITLTSAKDIILKASGDREGRWHQRDLRRAVELQGRGPVRGRPQVQRHPDHQGLPRPDQLTKRGGRSVPRSPRDRPDRQLRHPGRAGADHPARGGRPS